MYILAHLNVCTYVFYLYEYKVNYMSVRLLRWKRRWSCCAHVWLVCCCYTSEFCLSYFFTRHNAAWTHCFALYSPRALLGIFSKKYDFELIHVELELIRIAGQIFTWFILWIDSHFSRTDLELIHLLIVNWFICWSLFLFRRNTARNFCALRFTLYFP